MNALTLVAQTSSSDGGATAMTVTIILIGCVVAWVWALVDALLVPDDSLYRAGSKVMWTCLIVFLGVIGALIYAAAGAPTSQKRNVYQEVRTRKARGQSLDGLAHAIGHDVLIDPQDNVSPVSKITYPGSVSPPAPVVAPPPAPAAPEFKACPDCAEEIRFAALKCRFCGYMFDPPTCQADQRTSAAIRTARRCVGMCPSSASGLPPRSLDTRGR
jgi:Uncharacterised protein family UPF0547/Phospholipase_D-nuclease N-terminal